ncbi:esterase [Bifidobacterium sp. 82T24]|uniref:alpha/beta hydrolase n=1 Tax=Bifidobacterium pluvialisilvae TaxID=2834436 RepID=UPI001C574A1B|nr:alpha/beta hydrolase-fold protein [Bifidobacterium pluvialisilvae]MBW3087302.1 esterase [Bifidobacterium pluvialisilvae]
MDIASGWAPAALAVLACAGVVSLTAARIVIRRRVAAVIAPCVGLAGGFAVGFVVAWLLDRFTVFGVSLGMKVVWAAAIGTSVVGSLAAVAVASSGIVRAIAAVMVPVGVLSCAVNINAVYGEYPTVGSVLGVSAFSGLDVSELHEATMTVGQWRHLAKVGGLPAIPQRGKVGSVGIPATKSGFRAREAVVYLPPAALSARPPKLPVMLMLSGQPGSPDRTFLAGGLADVLDAYAARHHGLAPIVVSVDQLGNPLHNTLCVDSTKYGNVETYLTQDVTDWAESNLPVSHDARQWAIGGFSQGGTCSVQLGPSHPERYGSMFTVGSELGPHNGSEQSMIREFFNGDPAAYRRHVPIDIMRSRGHSNQLLIMASGQLDTESIRNIGAIAPVAKSIGMDVTAFTVADTGHDWHAVRQAFEAGLGRLGARMGLSDESDGRIVASANIRIMAVTAAAHDTGRKQ